MRKCEGRYQQRAKESEKLTATGFSQGVNAKLASKAAKRIGRVRPDESRIIKQIN